MKKGVVLSVAALVLLTGCGNKVKCSNKNEDTGAKYTYVGTFKKDNLQKYTISVKYKTKDEAKESCDAAKQVYDKKDVKCSGKTVKVTQKRPADNDEKVTKKEFKDTFCKD